VNGRPTWQRGKAVQGRVALQATSIPRACTRTDTDREQVGRVQESFATAGTSSNLGTGIHPECNRNKR
jgi:hypothetical protein